MQDCAGQTYGAPEKSSIVMPIAEPFMDKCFMNKSFEELYENEQ